MRACVRPLCFAVFLWTVGHRADAQNLIPDPTFSSGVEGWTLRVDAPTELLWIPEPGADGGRGYATMRPFSGIINSAARICVPVEAGVTYSWGGFLRLDAPIGNHALFEILFYSDASCEGLSLGGSLTSSVGTQDSPDWHLKRGPDVTAPEGAVRAAFEVVLFSGIDPGRIDFDNVFLGPQGVGPPSSIVAVPVASPVAFFILAAALALTAILVLRTSG